MIWTYKDYIHILAQFSFDDSEIRNIVNKQFRTQFRTEVITRLREKAPLPNSKAFDYLHKSNGRLPNALSKAIKENFGQNVNSITNNFKKESISPPVKGKNRRGRKRKIQTSKTSELLPRIQKISKVEIEADPFPIIPSKTNECNLANKTMLIESIFKILKEEKLRLGTKEASLIVENIKYRINNGLY